MKFALHIGLALASLASAVDEKGAMGLSCVNLDDKVIPVDLAWVSSVKRLYYPMMARLELYRVVHDMTGKSYNEISESSIYYDGCIKWDMEPNNVHIARGFDRKSRAYKAEVLSPNFEMFDLKPLEGSGYSGRGYSTFTDNSTFLVTPFCTTDGQMTFAVGSTTPRLPMEIMYKIKDHLISLGFKKEYITELRYDSCPKE